MLYLLGLSLCVSSFLVYFITPTLSLISIWASTFFLFCIFSLVYNFYRTKSIFNEYYSPTVLSTRGITLEESQDKQIDKETFQNAISTMKSNVIEKNSANHSKRVDSHIPIEKRNENRGLYGPENKAWEVARESAAFFGGGRAVFLQLAHPYVATGVQQHSKVANDIQKRFYNTFHHMFRLNFGDLKVAEKSAKQVRFIHEKVTGVLDSSPPYPQDSKYSANHEGAMIWVWATLTETSILMFELLVRRMTLSEKEEYYNDQKEFVRFFGIDIASLPEDWNSFMEYNKKMWNSEVLSVCPAAKRAEENLFKPRTLIAKLVNRLTRKITFALLPPRLAFDFGVHLDNFDYFVLYLFFASSRMVYSSLPGSFRYLTSYIEAEKRIRGYAYYNETLSAISASLAKFVLDNIIMDKSQNVPDFNSNSISDAKNFDSINIDVN